MNSIVAKIRDRAERSPILEREFEKFNGRYFKGRLPNFSVYLTSHITNQVDGMGLCDSERGRILVRQGLDETAAMETLLHEMIHAKVGSGHEMRFINEAKRLRGLGAPLARWELDLVEGYRPPRLTKKALLSFVWEAVHVHKLPRTLIPKYLEGEFYRPFSDIRRIADIRELLKEVEAKNESISFKLMTRRAIAK